jgi:Arc/MetJ-type ribon-helix-helix transcriptional regulator
MATGTEARRRVHVVLPQELMDEIDALVGARGRSRFIQETLESEMRRRRRVEAFQRVVGSIADGEIPEWETPESTAAWIDGLRRGWDETSDPAPR